MSDAVTHIFASRTVAAAAVLAILALAAPVAGCANRDREAEAQAATDRKIAELRRGAKWEEAPVGLPQDPVAVAQGAMPLAHIFDLPTRVQVTDLTTKAHLVTADVPEGGALVRIDARHGVVVGQQNVYPGPLAADHQYGIFALPTTPGVFRQGVGVPGDVPRK